MSHWNETSEQHRRESPGRSGDPLDRWVDRARRYLRSRTADHWLMFAAGLLLGALLA
ncbi:MAG: hypothetical protein RH942_08895 [Kiloniellaceae bacterium]